MQRVNYYNDQNLSETFKGIKLTTPLQTIELEPIDHVLADRLTTHSQPEWVRDAVCLLSYLLRNSHSCLYIPDWAGQQIILADKNSEKRIHFPFKEEWEFEFSNPPSLLAKQALICEHGRLFFQRLWFYEKEISRFLLAMKRQIFDLPFKQELTTEINRIFPINTAIEWQKIAVLTALTHQLTIISGGPGTGKTYILGYILRFLQQLYPNLRIALTAPTGKAAARMTESLKQFNNNLANGLNPADPFNYNAQSPSLAGQTIHRLLKYSPIIRGFHFNTQNSLPFDLVVVDEASMLDLSLFYHLLSAMDAGARLVLLGDRFQLASIEAGHILSDICRIPVINRYTSEFVRTMIQITSDPSIKSLEIESVEAVPLQNMMVELQKSHRVNSDHALYHLATRIRGINTEHDIDDTFDFMSQADKDTDRSFHWKMITTRTELYQLLKGSIEEHWREYFHAQEIKQYSLLFNRLRILLPFRGGLGGVVRLNRDIEKLLISLRWISPSKHSEFYHRKPLLITQNDYSLDLFNGDIGYCYQEKKELLVYFHSDGPEKPARNIPAAQLATAEPVYAMSIHKSQGSEFDHVWVVLPWEAEMINNPLLTRELLYTAITRARKSVTIVGHPEVIKTSLRNSTQRSSGLGFRLHSKIVAVDDVPSRLIPIS